MAGGTASKGPSAKDSKPKRQHTDDLLVKNIMRKIKAYESLPSASGSTHGNYTHTGNKKPSKIRVKRKLGL